MDIKILKQLFHTQSYEDILTSLETSEYGLKGDEVKRRLEVFGYNSLPEKKRRSLALVFLSQFNSTLVYILFVAAGASFAFGHIVDAVVILVVVIINAVFGFVQEYRSEVAISALKKLVKDTARVIRNGELHEVEARELVPGDIVFLESGDKVPVDGRVLSEHSLLTNEASLTGESLPQHKSAVILSEDTPLAERQNMLYSGTVVANGEGKIIATATGSYTELGKIAHDVQSTDFHGSKFMDRVNALGKRLGYLAIGGAVLVMGAGFITHMDLFDTVLLGVASAVSAIPEGLPVVLAVVLAIGVQRMARQNAIVKNLASVEPLGIATVVCTDKTGTLTKNVMTVTSILVGGEQVEVTGTGYVPQGDFLKNKKKIQPLVDEKLRHMLTYGALTNRASVVLDEGGENNPQIVGDPTEVALVVAAQKAGLKKDELLVDHTVFDTIPFNSEAKFQAALFTIPEEKNRRVVAAIGAYEALKPRATSLAWQGEHVVCGGDEARELERMQYELAREGHRLIAVAAKEVGENVEEITTEDIHDLTLLGVFAIIDPPREEVPDAIQKCHEAGIRLIMITGDSKDTAVAIAKKVGLLDPREKTTEGIYTEHELADFDDAQFATMAQSVKILARVSPTTKLRLVQVLQDAGEVVAMTGDGVNDAPALKAADIGVAMGRVGTDVARETARIVLSDDNFASLVKAIKEGRIVFNNIRKTTGYLITTNVAELLTLVVVLVLGLPMPLLPIQILLINLVTDGLPVISLAFEKDHGDVLKRAPFSRNESIVNSEIVHLMIINAVLMVGGVLILAYAPLSTGVVDYARTIAFVTISMFQSWNMLNMRSTNKSVFSLGLFSNPYVAGAFALSLVLQVIMMYTPFLQTVFSFVPLGISDWLIVFALTFSVVIVVEVYKYIVFKEKRFVQL